MEPTASFIQIGDLFYATIKSAGSESVVKDSAGQSIVFDSSTRAVAHAARLLAPKTQPRALAPRPDSEGEQSKRLHQSWKAEGIERYMSDRAKLDLIGVEVVVKRKWKTRPTA